MDIHGIRTILKSKVIYDIPLRVVYYARVSSEKDEQLNSLNNQQLYYDDYIVKNKNWSLIGRYVDEGLSAITTTKRENFHRMIADAKAGKFDFIITKEITRFARNTLDSIQFTRELLSYGVAIWFQNDNINTLDEDAELRLTIMAGIAQDEVRKLSSRIKFGHSQAIKNGVVMGNSRIYGYDKQKGKLIINEPEAEMIRLIFSLYATGDYSTPKIERILYEKGYRNRKGGTINRNVLKNIIPNPKYKGYYCGNKVKVVDMFTKKQKFLPEDEWVMYKDESIVPAIVDENLWDRANAIYLQRSNEVKSRRTSFKPGNLFTGKLFCQQHGTTFYMKQHRVREQEPNPTWVCSHKIKNGTKSCDTFSVKENELTVILLDVLQNLSGDMNSVIEKYLDYVKKIYKTTDVSVFIKSLEDEITLIDSKKERLLELSLDGALSNEEFSKRNNSYNEEVEKKLKEIQGYKNQEDSQKENEKSIFKLKNELTLLTEKPLDKLTSGIINTFIEKILVSSVDADTMNLDIYLKTGTVASTNMSRLGNFASSRSGYMVKKMIEAQQKQMANGSMK